LHVLPSGEVMGILVNDIESESLAIGVDVELVVIVASEELSGVEGEVEGDAHVAHSHAEGLFVVGLELGG